MASMEVFDGEVNKRVAEMIASLPISTNEALVKIGGTILPKMIEQVPFNVGDLQASLFSRVEGGNTLLVGSEGCDYAVIQHENLEYRHDGNRKAKYVEDPWREVTSTEGLAIIAEKITKQLEGKK